ncbi:hypothetical protein LguiA_011757 [Lonicera macranthoides]
MRNEFQFNNVKQGTIKINTDGSCFNKNPTCGSYGGLARSDQGKWIEGFCGFIGVATPIEAKLRGIRQGLRLAKEKEWIGICIESNCQKVVDLIKVEDEETNHPCRNLIAPNVQHILREGNRCVDKMARIRKSQHERLVKILVPPIELVEDLNANLEGIAFPRGF